MVRKGPDLKNGHNPQKRTVRNGFRLILLLKSFPELSIKMQVPLSEVLTKFHKFVISLTNIKMQYRYLSTIQYYGYKFM